MIPNEVSKFETLVGGVDLTEATTEHRRQVETNDKWKFTLDQILVKNEPLSLDGCVYRGEGNANIVVSLPHERKVVRFRKSSSSVEASPDGGMARTIREVDFLKYVISGFLSDYVEHPAALRITREDMTKMSRDIRCLRPEYRRLKDIVEEYATIFTDYAFLRKRISDSLKYTGNKATFCVEIKPKQGFRHEMDEKFDKCTYCLTQYYKLKSGAIKCRSNYCPFDLFSGDNTRMKKSLRGLLESPQNNLKIFKDGVVVYDTNSNLSDLENVFTEWFSTWGHKTVDEKFEIFFKLVKTALLRQFSSTRETITTNKPPAGFTFYNYDFRTRINPEIVDKAKKILHSSRDRCNFVGDELPSGSVLERILNMQQLSYHSADVVYKIYSKHFAWLNDDSVYSKMIKSYGKENCVSNGENMNGEGDDLTSSNTTDSAIKFSTQSRTISDSNGNQSKNITKNCIPSLDLRNNNVEMKGTISNEELEALENYLLVTTAKDCSILVAFKEIDSRDVSSIPEDYIIRSPEGINFVVNVGVLDLDPKTVHSVEKHRQRDTNVLVSLINLLDRDLDFRNKSSFDPA